MDDFLPVWAQPHRFWPLIAKNQAVFTFGLVLTELRSLAHPDGVRSFGGRYGYEWLPGLSAGVQHETDKLLPESELCAFLRDEHGILGPNTLNLDKGLSVGEAGEPSDDLVGSFASIHGAQIARWTMNAFNGLEVSLSGWARARQAVPLGYGQAAAARLKQTRMPHRLRSVNSIDGRHHWTRGYTDLYQRVALELEDLAVRRPTPRICPLCNRVYIPLRRGQTVCANQAWDEHSRKLISRCTPESATATYDAAAAADYRKRRKTQWAAMNRARAAHGHNDHRGVDAIARWDTWRNENPPPRKPGRPRRASAVADDPIYLPGNP